MKRPTHGRCDGSAIRAIILNALANEGLHNARKRDAVIDVLLDAVTDGVLSAPAPDLAARLRGAPQRAALGDPARPAGTPRVASGVRRGPLRHADVARAPARG